MNKKSFWYSSLLFPILVFTSCFPIRSNSRISDFSRDSIRWKIDFQTGFEEDTLTVCYENDTIIDKAILTTSQSNDFAGLSITCKQNLDKNNHYLLTVAGQMDKQTIKYYPITKPNEDSILCVFFLNNQKIIFNVALDSANYWGVSKLNRNNLLGINQQKQPFSYY